LDERRDARAHPFRQHAIVTQFSLAGRLVTAPNHPHRTHLARLLRAGLIGLCLVLAHVAVAQEESGHRLERIVAGKKLRVCMWPGHYSLSYRNPRTREAQGVDVDLVRELASELKVAAEFIDSSLQQTLEAVSAGRCDLAITLVDMPAPQAVRFTTPHLGSGIHAVATRGSRRIKQWDDIDRPGVVVAVLLGSMQETLAFNTFQYAQLVSFPDEAARELAVESGRADILMTSYPYSLYLVRNTDWARMIDPPDRSAATLFTWAVPKGENAWFQYVQHFIETIKRDGRLLRAVQRHPDAKPMVVLAD
jgi:ABC-type amino acid transport substrate-binding protein